MDWSLVLGSEGIEVGFFIYLFYLFVFVRRISTQVEPCRHNENIRHMLQSKDCWVWGAGAVVSGGGGQSGGEGRRGERRVGVLERGSQRDSFLPKTRARSPEWSTCLLHAHTRSLSHTHTYFHFSLFLCVSLFLSLSHPSLSHTHHANTHTFYIWNHPAWRLQIYSPYV